MNLRIFRLWREHPLALLTEIGLFAAFAISFYIIATLETPVSTWAILPHILCNVSVAVLLIRHRLQGRPAMYWSQFDAIVVLIFLCFLVNIYYSEIRSISWQTAALYMDALAAYFLGRMVFYHRVRLYAVVMMAALAVSCLGIYYNVHTASGKEAEYRVASEQMLNAPPVGVSADQAGTQADELVRRADFEKSIVDRLKPVQRVYVLIICFWALSFVFLMLEKPSALAFIVYTGGIVGLYAFYVLGRMGWMFSGSSLSEIVSMRHSQVESLRTAQRILTNYPLTGGGLGTFPVLFDAYRQVPGVSYDMGFNAYVYAAVETGIIVVALLLYFLVRAPLHVARRWRLFPNNRLRFAVLVHLVFFVAFVVQGFHDSALFNPAVWFPVWAIIGTFISLVVIRDPVRIFDSLIPHGRQIDPVHAERRISYSGSVSGFGRTPLARLPRPKLNFLKRYRIGPLIATAILTAVVFGITVLEVAPYAALRHARLTEGEDEASKEYGTRVLQATRLFPFDSTLYSRLGDHYSARIKDPLQIYEYADRMEGAYQRAVELNPYRPDLYEQLYFLFRDTNRSVDALDAMRKGVETNPNDLVLRLLLVRELEKVGSLASATWHVKRALFRVAPDKTELFLRLAELYELQGLNNDAKLYYQYARQVVPDSPQTTTRLRRLEQRLGLTVES